MARCQKLGQRKQAQHNPQGQVSATLLRWCILAFLIGQCEQSHVRQGEGHGSQECLEGILGAERQCLGSAYSTQGVYPASSGSVLEGRPKAAESQAQTCAKGGEAERSPKEKGRDVDTVPTADEGTSSSREGPIRQRMFRACRSFEDGTTRPRQCHEWIYGDHGDCAGGDGHRVGRAARGQEYHEGYSQRHAQGEGHGRGPTTSTSRPNVIGRTSHSFATADVIYGPPYEDACSGIPIENMFGSAWCYTDHAAKRRRCREKKACVGAIFPKVSTIQYTGEGVRPSQQITHAAGKFGWVWTGMNGQNGPWENRDQDEAQHRLWGLSGNAPWFQKECFTLDHFGLQRGSRFYESRTATTSGPVDALCHRHSFTRSCVHKQHNNQFTSNCISKPAREDYAQISMQLNMDGQTHRTSFTMDAFEDKWKEKILADLPYKATHGNTANVDGHRGCYYETEDAYYQETEDVEYKIKKIGASSASYSDTWYQKLRGSFPRSSTQAGDPKEEDNGYDDNPGQVCLLQVTASLQALTWTGVVAWDDDFFQNVMARQQANNMFGLPTQSWAWARLQARIPGPTESNRLQIYRSSAPIFRQPNYYQLHTTMESTPIQVVTTIGMAWNDLTPTDGHSIFWQLHIADYHSRFSPTVLPGHSIQVLVSSQENAALHGLHHPR